MRLRIYDYFRLSDKDFDKTDDKVNLYQIRGIPITDLTKRDVINVDNGQEWEIDEDELMRATPIVEPGELIKAFSFCNELKTANAETESNYTSDDYTIAESAKTDNADMINNPPHYTHGMECIDEMILLFGEEIVKAFCMCNAWKYRKRALYKNGEEDMKKSDWYINKIKELGDTE